MTPMHATTNWRLKSGIKKYENFNLNKIDLQHNASARNNELETEVRYKKNENFNLNKIDLQHNASARNNELETEVR